MLYGRSQWDPLLILAQICALQLLFFATLCALVAILVGPYAPRGVTLHHVLDWRMYQFHTFQGWMVIAANVLNVVPTAFAMRVVLGRARQCLDFAATVYLVHALAVWLFSGFPRSLTFWLGSVGCVAVISSVAEWLLMRKELEEIPLAALRPTRGPAAVANGGGGNAAGNLSGGGNVTEGSGHRQGVQLTQR